jgi:hypothetical protein
MQKITNFFTSNSYTAPAFIIAVSLIIVALVFKSGASTFANKTDSITVTGSAERIVKSDTAKWTITISTRSNGADANAQVNLNLKSGVNTIKSFLTKNGIASDNIKLGQVMQTQICALSAQGYENCSLGVIGQNANQQIVVESDDVNKIEKLAQDISGTTLNMDMNQNVEYYYNNLKNIRVEMLSEATKNAKERAVSVADAGGASIGSITSLSSGVFQVTTKNSVNYDDYGAYDTSTIEKKITATVKANFSLK